MKKTKQKNIIERHPYWTASICVVIALFFVIAITDTPSNTTVDNTINQNDIKRLAVEYTLAEHGYPVLDVIKGNNYAEVKMISMGITEYDVALQVASGLGALKGVYPNKDNYIVTLVNSDKICSFSMDNYDIERSEYMSNTEYIQALKADCN